MVQASPMEPGGHCGCGFRHILASIPEFSELSQTQGHHQLFSEQYLLAAASCNLMVSGSPLVTMQPFWAPTNPCLTSTLTSCQLQS